MTPKATFTVFCPKCEWRNEVEKGDKFHPLGTTEKPKESDVTEDVIKKIQYCRNPNCLNPIRLYYYQPKMSFDVV